MAEELVGSEAGNAKVDAAKKDATAPHVLVAVTGGIAAYKACEVVRGLQKAGCAVRVTMTAEATAFVGPTTFEALTHHGVLTGLFAAGHEADDPIAHITAAEWADAALVVPATANAIAKLACGIADDALTTALLALPSAKPLLVAPAMNVHMWQAAATQANVATLASRGVRIVSPETGRLACGDVGEGKLASVDVIVAATLAALRPPAEGPLSGRRLVITAGPTHEAIDPVRFIGNRSSGKMGFAIAKAAAAAGAQVTLVAGPCDQPTPAGVDRVDVVSAAQMYEATNAAFATADAAICAAAVADYTPAAPADHKLKKGREELDHIDLVRTTDILAALSADKGDRVVVGFAAETNDLIANAQAKLARKGCDLIVANDVSRADSAFGSDTDRVTFVTADGCEELPTLTKAQVADEIVKKVTQLLSEKQTEATVAKTGETTAQSANPDSPAGEPAWRS